MTTTTTSPQAQESEIRERAAGLFRQNCSDINCRTDRLFARLMVLQWIVGIVASLWISPLTWAGANSETHIHVWSAIFVGGLITAFPVFLALTRPGTTLTRHVIAIGQMLTSALLIHLTGGRIETHFHVFGSLAFLAVYRDWRVLITATVVVAVDHLVRGMLYPQSVFGVLAASPWRVLEHAAWVGFENVFLIITIRQSVREMKLVAQHRAKLEKTNEIVEAEVTSRTNELKKQANDLTSVLDAASHVSIIATDPDGLITTFNSGAERMLGYTAEEMVGKQTPAVIHLESEVVARGKELSAMYGEDVQGFDVFVACARAGGHEEREWTYIRKDGSQFPVNLIVTAKHDHQGKIVGFLGIGLDIQALREAVDNAEAANRARSEFLANMSHEIRTPMTAILGFTDLLLDNVKKQESIDCLQTVKENGEYLITLLNDILDLSKIEAEKCEVERIECEPRKIVSDVASLMEVRAKAKNLPLHVRFDGPIPETIQSDPTRLSQILINLVGNAIKFTETGAVQIVTRLVDESGSEPTLRFDVIDTGIGVDEDQIAKLFQPFTQADGSTTRRFGGTGLGLTISRRLVELLGGEISVTGAVGKGSTFSVTVSTGPLDKVRLIHNADESVTEGVKTEPASRTALKNIRVLLAEDGPDNQRLISFLLKKAGAEVTLADNGQIAFDLATDASLEGRPFHVILMDMQMPVLDGYSATRRLRDNGYSGPILALTAHAMSTDRQKCLDAGCDDYATKPVDRNKLIKTVATYAERDAGSNGAESVVISAK